MSQMRIVEIFGPTIQGEGPYIGQICTFVRTAGCDNNCKWCDTKYAQSEDTGEQMTIESIVREVREINTEHVVITGGNPALQYKLKELCIALRAEGYFVQIETQGTRFNQGFYVANTINLSPKPLSSNNALPYTQLEKLIEDLQLHRVDVNLKIVIFNHRDIEYAETIHMMHPDVPMTLQVGNPNVDSKQDNHPDDILSLLVSYHGLIERIATMDTMNDVRILPQMHTLLYGNRRGV